MSAYDSGLKIVAIASGKGGVGKTNVSVNLAVALARLGRRVMLFDADLGLANADLLLGLRPQRTLHDLVNGEVEDLKAVLVEGPEGILLVPSASGIASMANLTPTEHAGLIRAFSSYRDPLDVLIVDTAAGVQESVTSFCKAVQEVLVVVCDEPASMTDAYALMKVLYQDHGLRRFRLVCNMVASAEAARRLAQKLTTVLTQYLPEVVVDVSAAIPLDEHLRRAVQKRVPVVSLYPSSPSGRAFSELARRVDGWKTARSGSGGLSFFVERMLERA
ncbi:MULTISPECIES: MinD/ParA family protein [Thiorhodovibrio]|uniref:MinD/ParA family protein n=1 Tax=Thiorhodovibrio TaxID=61593 RepID=UPI001911DF3E|nr:MULTISPECIES: MinD/ParA family protein [Thiorhodovibrio]MBK5971018.1 cobyrinic acid a,c-diamide synthase [Thiorhodovibrio winogradskyi]WPL10615.1 Flagellum site-determining protein YlxH [Thiorhodovibrio litoralis]